MTPDPPSLREMTERQRAHWYPNLTPDNYHQTSLECKKYNCVAWIFNITHRPIDLSIDEDGDPKDDIRFLRPEVYIEMFKEHGFELCDLPTYEHGFEKIALYIHNDGWFEHVARQLENGHWSSKVGEYEDIEHYDLQALEKPTYMGIAKIFMKRPRI